MIKPLYVENIIVGVKYKNKFNWYITEPDLSFSDRRLLPQKCEGVR
ncbi:hypothetical protein ICG_05656 [Bacillus cereus BAG1X1-3]|nr:hypothetical protein ICG_05656 [Bacillus cereus BAG1X1-3]EOO76236.1 hypothetical protein IC7_05815 [Bacillus cereus BAG1O-1]